MSPVPITFQGLFPREIMVVGDFVMIRQLRLKGIGLMHLEVMGLSLMKIPLMLKSFLDLLVHPLIHPSMSIARLKAQKFSKIMRMVQLIKST